MFDRAFIDKLKASISMKDLASLYIKDLSRASGNIWSGSCPHPDHNDSLPSFRVWEHTNTWACMGCHSGKKDNKENFGTDPIAFVQWMEGVSYKQAVHFLAEAYHVPIPDSKFDKEYQNNKEKALYYHENLTSEAMKYLKEVRKLNISTIEEFKIGFDGNKITFPLIDRYHNYLGFSKRSLDGSHPKYINSKNSQYFNKSKFLYGTPQIDLNDDTIHIVEGPMDVASSYQSGLKNAVAPLGTSFTEDHARMVLSYRKKIVICMDPDESGIKASAKIYEMFSKLGVYPNIFENAYGKDIDDLSKSLGKDLPKLVKKHSIPYLQYSIDRDLKAYEKELYELQLKYLPKLEKLCDSLSTPTDQAIARHKIYNRTGIQLKKESALDANMLRL